MEDYPITPAPETAPDSPGAQERLAALAQQLTERLEAGLREENARRQALESREADLNRREMTAKTREELDKRGLPAALADCLVFSDESAMLTGVSVLEEAFRAAVQSGVEERLLSGAPKAASLTPLSELSDEEYYAAVCRND